MRIRRPGGRGLPIALAGLGLIAASSCGDDEPGGPSAASTGGGGGFTAPEREDGDRTPLTGACDDVDPERCLTPWPSDAFAVADPATATGLRLAVPIERINPDDDGVYFARADGFSRVTPLVASFAGPLDASSAEGSVQLLLAQHDHPQRGAVTPLRVEVDAFDDEAGQGMLVAHPRVPLEAGADYVVVITDALRGADGAPVAPSRSTEIALDRAPPASQEEADLRGHHAPMRRLLADAGIAPDSIVRAWTFTTRSAEDPRQRLRQMREAALQAVDEGRVDIVVESVEPRAEGAVAAIVRGHLGGLPDFLDADGVRVDGEGRAVASGTREAPFRVVIPRGAGDYRMLMFGHGTGGSVDDVSFDEAIAAAGAAKVSFELYGWTGSSVVATFVGMQDVGRGASFASGALVQAVADGSAIRRAMGGPLGDLLAGAELGGAPNPHQGRRPDDSVPLWVGGSLGGTIGLLFTAADPEMDHAVLNVPGAAWTSWVREAEQFRYIEPFMAAHNGGATNLPLAIAMAQGLFDEADGASWVDVLQGEHPIVALAQESIGDPVLPNQGTEMVAHVLGAAIVGVPLVPIAGLESTEAVESASGLTQYWVEGDLFQVHGFAAQDTPAGAAATEQVIAFVESVWSGAPIIEVPSGCPTHGCDFR